MSPSHHLPLDGELTIYRASELKPLMLAALNTGSQTVEFDLSGVTEIDTAGVQLLMLSKRDAMARHIDLRLTAHSPAVIDVFQLLDLASYFGDPLLMPAGQH